MLTELSDYVNIFLACDAHVQCASGSVVEPLLAKEGAAGSIPVSRFFNAKKQHPKRVLFFALNEPNPGLEGSKSRLPARSLLLQSRVIHRMTATRLALFIKKNLKGCCFFALNEPNPGLEDSKSRLPARSLLLQSTVIHRMTATRLALFIKKNLKGCCFFVFIGRKPATK